MIQIAGYPLSPDSEINRFPPGSIEKKIVDIMTSSSAVYSYNSTGQLKFELDLRKYIINAARDLYRSGLRFETFPDSKCNEKYWTRTNDGGFSLKAQAKPSEAITDIFRNGRAYGTECSTAIVIVFYKAVLSVFPEDLFNRVFPRIQLMNWRHIDNDLRIQYIDPVPDFLPGDCLYFRNPDVNPLTPQWQGENAIDLGNGTYYGHGVGIRTAQEIIAALNRHRRRGSEQSAYLLDSATRPNFRHLFNIYMNN